EVERQMTSPQLDAPTLIVVRVFLGGPLEGANPEGNPNEHITQGSVLASVNGIPVTDIRAYRDALLRPFSGRFLSIVTTTNAGDVVSMDTVLSTERLLIYQYDYPPSKTFVALMEGEEEAAATTAAEQEASATEDEADGEEDERGTSGDAEEGFADGDAF